MYSNTECLMAACKNLNIPFRLVDDKTNFVEVQHKKLYYFVNNAVPINSTTSAYICKDKDFTYRILSPYIRMPKSLAYLDPNCQEKFIEYLSYFSIDEILKDISGKLDFPLVIKRNAGSQGNNVFLCNNTKEVETNIKEIFNHASKDYDYIALAQEYIPIQQEYRVIILNGKIELVYEKNISDATFIGNISPLHFDGAKAITISEPDLIKKLTEFITPIFERFDIKYAGLDIAIDKHNNFFLIELNSKPMFDHFTKDNGMEKIIELYEKILKITINQ